MPDAEAPSFLPLVDLSQQYRALHSELEPALAAVLEQGDFILGKAVGRFEAAFARFVGARFCVGLGSGTDALHLILRGLEIGPGDEVITATNSFIATAEAISFAGATPVLVDCLEDTYLIDPAAVRAAVTPRTRAIIPVHLYGQPADLDSLQEIARRHGLRIIEDAAQAHGGVLRGGRRCGALGDAAAFSFYPGKNLGAYGDGGAATTGDAALDAGLRSLRNWGSRVKYQHERKGFNSRLDTLQAAVLEVKLRHLERWNEQRRHAVARYREHLQGEAELQLPREAPWTERHAYHLFVVRVPGRNARDVVRRLHADGIGAGVHYPTPIHLQPAYADLGLGAGAFPVAERVSREILSLPLFPEITEAQVAAVAGSLKRALAAVAPG